MFFVFFLTGWLWLPATAVLPRDRCVSTVLQCCDSYILSQCGREMGARNSQTLSQSPNCSSRHTVWSAKWRESVDRASTLQRGACARRRCREIGRKHRCNVHGVLGSHPEKLEGSVRYCPPQCPQVNGLVKTKQANSPIQKKFKESRNIYTQEYW